MPSISMLATMALGATWPRPAALFALLATCAACQTVSPTRPHGPSQVTGAAPPDAPAAASPMRFEIAITLPEAPNLCITGLVMRPRTPWLLPSGEPAREFRVDAEVYITNWGLEPASLSYHQYEFSLAWLELRLPDGTRYGLGVPNPDSHYALPLGMVFEPPLQPGEVRAVPGDLGSMTVWRRVWGPLASLKGSTGPLVLRSTSVSSLTPAQK